MESLNFKNKLRFHELQELILFFSFSIFSQVSMNITSDKEKEVEF